MSPGQRGYSLKVSDNSNQYISYKPTTVNNQPLFNIKAQ